MFKRSADQIDGRWLDVAIKVLFRRNSPLRIVWHALNVKVGSGCVTGVTAAGNYVTLFYLISEGHCEGFLGG